MSTQPRFYLPNSTNSLPRQSSLHSKLDYHTTNIDMPTNANLRFKPTYRNSSNDNFLNTCAFHSSFSNYNLNSESYNNLNSFKRSDLALIFVFTCWNELEIVEYGTVNNNFGIFALISTGAAIRFAY